MYKSLGHDDYKPKNKPVKPTKEDIGMFIRPDGIAQLDMYKLSVDEANNRLIIESRQTKTSYLLNLDSVTEFVNRFNEITFEDF